MYRSNKELFVGLYWVQKILYQINIVKFNLPKKAKYHPHPPPANTNISRTHSLGNFLGPLRVFKTCQNSNLLSVMHLDAYVAIDFICSFNPDLNILISLVAMYTNYVCYKTFNICNYMHEYRFIEVLHAAYCFSSYCICSFFAQIW